MLKCISAHYNSLLTLLFVSLYVVWSNPRNFASPDPGKVWESYMAENLVSLFYLSTKGNSKNKADVRAEDNHTEANKN